MRFITQLVPIIKQVVKSCIDVLLITEAENIVQNKTLISLFITLNVPPNAVIFSLSSGTTSRSFDSV